MRRLVAALAVFALSLTFGLHSSGHALAAAWDLRADQSCSYTTPGSLSAQLSWSMESNSAQQWIDVSDKDNGWLPGTFVSMPVAPSASSQTLVDLAPGSTYYVEVAQMYPDGSWQFSPTRMLKARSCFSVAARTTAYGSFFGQNPSESPRTITAISETNGTPSVTVTTSKSSDSSSGGSSSSTGSSGGGGANNCGVVAKNGSPVQAPLNASANGTASISGC